MFGCQQVLLNPTPELRAVLEFICEEANKLHNCAVYYTRQIYFKTGMFLRPFDIINELKRNSHYSALCAQAAQQVCGAVGEAVISFKGLIKLFRSGGLESRPKFPDYRAKGGLQVISYPKQALSKNLVDGQVIIPLGLKVKAWFGLKNFEIKMPSNLDYKDIREIRILPRNGCFYAEFVYQLAPVVVALDPNKALGVDSGLGNWLTCVSNEGESFIVDGKQVKSVNNWYNKQIANLKEEKPQGFWSKRLAGITEQRNRRMRDAVNKAARLVVNYCLERGIGTIVFGWNKGQKDNINLGAKTNQKFVQVPTARLKKRVEQLCQQYGIQFIETEESYTSQASFVDQDELRELPHIDLRYSVSFPIQRALPPGLHSPFGLTYPPRAGVLVPKTQIFVWTHTCELGFRLWHWRTTHMDYSKNLALFVRFLMPTTPSECFAWSVLSDGQSSTHPTFIPTPIQWVGCGASAVQAKFGEKPEGWQSSGRRIQRGLFRTGTNQHINADGNGAANILRKVAAKLGLDLSGVSMGSLTAPTRMRFWVTANKGEAASVYSAA